MYHSTSNALQGSTKPSFGFRDDLKSLCSIWGPKYHI